MQDEARLFRIRYFGAGSGAINAFSNIYRRLKSLAQILIAFFLNPAL